MDKQPLLSVIVVNYNSGPQLKQCVGALRPELTGIDAELIIVDNASTDGSADFLAGPGDGKTTLFHNSHPMGYGYAANQGFRAAKAKYVLFCNPDMVAVTGTIHNMIRHMQEDQSLGGVAGYYLKPGGEFDRFYNKFPTVKDIVLVHLPVSIAERFPSHRRYKMLDEAFNGRTVVEQPAGAFLAVEKKLFGDAYISPEFSMHFTDVDACKKIQLSGKLIAVFKDCPVYHNHATRRFTSQIEKNYAYILDFFLSATVYFRKYEGVPAWLFSWVMLALINFIFMIYEPLKAKSSGGKLVKTFCYRALVLFYFLLGKNLIRQARDRVLASDEFRVSRNNQAIQSG